MNKKLIARIGVVLLILLGIPGLNLAFNPAGIHEIFDITLNNVDSEIGLRADLSGVFLGVTVLLLLGLLQSRGSWLLSSAIIIGAILVVRVYGVIIHGYTETQGVVIALEVVMIGIMVFAARTFDSDG